MEVLRSTLVVAYACEFFAIIHGNALWVREVLWPSFFR
jgi:hypothetical protein